MSKVCWYYTKRLKLRPFQYIDSNNFFQLLTHPLIKPSLGASKFLAHPHLVKKFLEQMSSEKNKPQSWLLYSIFDKNDHQFIGGCGYKVDSEYINAEMFYLLFPEFWGKGLAVEACTALLDNSLKRFGLQKIHAFILPENIRAQRVAVKLGFSYLEMVELNRYDQKRLVQKWNLNLH